MKKSTPGLDRLRAYLRRHPSTTASEAARALGVSRQRVYAMLSALKYRLGPPQMRGGRIIARKNKSLGTIDSV